MRRHHPLAIIVLAVLSFGVTQNPVTVTGVGNTYRFTLQTGGPLRYFADYQAQTLYLPGVTLANPDHPLPTSLITTQDQDGVTLEINSAFRVSLSPDQRTLVLVRRSELGAEPTQISDDERAPVLYRLANADPAQVSTLLTSLYDNLKVEVDTRQRALLVLLNPTDRVLVDELITALDAPLAQVMFEAEILEINQDVTQSLGINYDSIFTFTLSEGAVETPLRLGAFARNPLSLTFGLNVLKTNGAAEVLARPRITTLDGVPAQLNATQTVPVIVPGANGQQSVQNITTGITLQMTPRISPDGTVEADLSISVSTPTGTTSQGVPQFSSRDAQTTVRVGNGEPIAIGGLFEQREIVGVQKVPLLGDIPLLGALFTSRRTEERRTDLIIVVTPRIIDMPGLHTIDGEEPPTRPGGM